jgi:hypothetical protein
LRTVDRRPGRSRRRRRRRIRIERRIRVVSQPLRVRMTQPLARLTTRTPSRVSKRRGTDRFGRRTFVVSGEEGWKGVLASRGGDGEGADVVGVADESSERVF